MSRQHAPWTNVVTPRPVQFCFSRQGHIVTATTGVGQQAIISRLHLGTGEIVQAGKETPPFRLRLNAWYSAEPPIVRAHPFLALHLLATVQVNRDELMAHLAGLTGNTVRTTLAITQPCELLRMLGRRRAGLTLSTHFNFPSAQG